MQKVQEHFRLAYDQTLGIFDVEQVLIQSRNPIFWNKSLDAHAKVLEKLFIDHIVGEIQNLGVFEEECLKLITKAKVEFHVKHSDALA